MKHLRISQSAATLVLSSVLSVAVLGAGIDTVGPGDGAFTHHAMAILLQGVSNADAAESGGGAGVKALATKVQSDEITIGDQLVSLASFYGISVSTNAPKASTDAAGYTADQAKSLSSLITLFENEASSGGSQLRTFASNSLPTLRADLSAVQAHT
ncbi:MAG TPA: hypothetical protein VMA98_13860 [Candidatus Acidoferrales bacterium]|nr:hypothetical protein [Candidatus Acidoferrales bacterium]